MSNLTQRDIEIFERAASSHNLNEFTEYYFRLAFSGTRYTPEDRVEDYSMLHEAWLAVGKPERDLTIRVDGKSVAFKVLHEDYSEPTFLLPHGYVLAPWAQIMAHALIVDGKRIVVAEGGAGGSKTSSVGILGMSFCALIPGFDFLNVAPTTTQAQDMLEDVEKWATGSEFERFIVKPNTGRLFKLKPFPTMVVQIGDSVKSTFGCMTLGIHGDYILGKDKDWLNVDEAGLVQGIGEAIPRLVTRLRGVRRDGRPRWAAMSFITNPHLNPSFQRLLKRAKLRAQEPKSLYYYARPRTVDNPSITAKQIKIQREMIDPADRARWHDGDRSAIEIAGEIPPVLIENCHDEGLDAIMEEAVIRGDPNVVYTRRENMGIMHWQLPPDPDAAYIVAGDPGTNSPLKMGLNNVPVVIVVDVTEFPENPARLRAFHWIDGEGTYGPWKSCMQEMMDTYKCMGCYDATGTQSSFAQSQDFHNYNLWPLPMGGGVKALARTLFKLMCGDGFYAWPYLDGLWHQASVYREYGPGVKGIPDDIICTLFVLSYFLRLIYSASLSSKYPLPGEVAEEEKDRAASMGFERMMERYERGTTNRYGRNR